MAYGYVAGDSLIVYVRPDELRGEDAPWVHDAFQALCDGRATLSPVLERWAFPLDLRIGIERLLGLSQHPLNLLTADECEARAGRGGISEHAQET